MPSLRSSGAYRSLRRTLRRAAHPRELAFQRQVRRGFESRFLDDPGALAAYEEEIRESGLLEHVREKRKEYDAIVGAAGGDGYTPGGIGLAERTYLYAILRTLKQPTFITIDADFWDRELCHPAYAIVYFALDDDEQEQLPLMLRSLWRRPEFRTRSRRMGKVARVGHSHIDWWQFQVPDLYRVAWTGA